MLSDKLPKQLLNDILKLKDISISNFDERRKMIRSSLSCKRVRVILDDVDHAEQLEKLVGNHNWFGPGSRIIITARDEHLLHVHRVDEKYKVGELDKDNSLELFSRKAFSQKRPPEDFMKLSSDVLAYAKNLPLVLKVLASDLKELKYFDLSGSKNLIEIPDLTSAPNLEKLVLEGRASLSELHPSVWTHKRLQHLILRRCPVLRSFPCTIEMASLKTLDLEGCVKLEKFPEVCNMERLETLSLQGTSLEELPSSVGELTGLKILDMTFCEKLKSICKLKSLEKLDLGGCSQLKRLPELYNMERLETLSLRGTSLEELPSSVGELTGLKILDISYCRKLKSLPRSIGKLKSLKEKHK